MTPAQLAWLYRVRSIANEMIVGPFSDLALQRAINSLQDLLLSVEEARHVPRILADAGVRFVIVETIGSAKIDGVCFWLDACSPVVGMSVRHDRIDNFWFVLRHELEHVRRGHGKNRIRIDIELEEDSLEAVATHMVEEERQANEAAAEFCVPENLMRQFIDRKAPMFPERDILGFARMIGVHPGLVTGQLRFRTGIYNRFHRHLTKIRSIVAPSAVADGWGDIAPLSDR